MQRFLNPLRGWIEAAHPFPLAAVLLLTALIALTSAPDSDLDAGRLVLALVAMLLSQLAIGWTNDYMDRDSDRNHQRTKPIASGRLDARYMPLAIALVILGSLVCGVLLGPAPLLFLIAGTAAGLSYDLWLKQSHWSWLSYVVAFTVLPLFVWSSLDLFRRELLAGYAVALPLAPAAHLANVLPDLDADMAAGRRNLALIWGRAVSLRIMAFCLLAPVAVTLLSLSFLEYNVTLLGLILGVYGALLGLAAFCYRQGLESPGFKTVALASVLFVAGWLAAI